MPQPWELTRIAIIANGTSTTRFPSSHRWTLCVTPKSQKGGSKREFLHLALPFISSLQVTVDISNLICGLNIASPSLRMHFWVHQFQFLYACNCMLSVFMCLQKIWNIQAHEGIAVFFDKIWMVLKSAGNSVVAFDGSDKSRLVTASDRRDVPFLWRRLVVVAHSSVTSLMTVWECLTKSQWGAAWGQLCHALQTCKRVPAWDSRHGSRLDSSLGCLVATGRVHWTQETTAAVAGQCRERGKLGRYPAGTRTCHQQYSAWPAVSAVSVARPGNNYHRPLQLAKRKRVENSRVLTRPLGPLAICWTSGEASTQQQCCASLCHRVRRRSRSAFLSV